MIKGIPVKNTSMINPVSRKKNLNLKEKMLDLNNYNLAITEILDNFFIINDKESENINDLMDKTSNFIGRNEESRERLKKDLKAREEKGGTFVTDYGILLLHCRTKAVDKLHFGLVKVKKDIFCINSRDEKEKLDLGIVITAAEDCSKYLLEAVSYVNGMVVEKSDFVNLLKRGTEEEIFDEVSSILEDFYKLMNNKYLMK